MGHGLQIGQHDTVDPVDLGCHGSAYTGHLKPARRLEPDPAGYLPKLLAWQEEPGGTQEDRDVSWHLEKPDLPLGVGSRA